MAAERPLLLGVAAALAASALLLLTGVPSASPPHGTTLAAADPLASTAPRRSQPEVAALVAACNAASADQVEPLQQLARSDDPLVAGNAIRALGRLGAVRGDRELLARLDQGPPRVRHELIAALGNCGDRSVAPLLERQVYGGDAQARYLAVRALVQLQATEQLDRVLQDPRVDASTRSFARAAVPLSVPAVLATTAGLPER